VFASSLGFDIAFFAIAESHLLRQIILQSLIPRPLSPRFV